jgi:ribose/xylose/arabinose/galactoside ABC-type transport system permease subunit
MSLNTFMKIVRFWVPIAILVAGVVLVIVRGGDETSLEGGAALWGAGLAVWLLNWLYRVGVSGDSARVEEDEARAYFARYGKWPDEVPPRQGS